MSEKNNNTNKSGFMWGVDHGIHLKDKENRRGRSLNDIYIKSEHLSEPVLINKDCRLIIVGTITPKDTQGEKRDGFYYSGSSTKLYEIIDEGLSKTFSSFDKTNGFKKHRDRKYTGDLVEAFKTLRIGFFDVVDKCIFPPMNEKEKTSASDNALAEITLDVDSFDIIHNIPFEGSIKYFFTSENAKYAFEQICDMKKVKYPDDTNVIRIFRISDDEKNKHADTFNEHFQSVINEEIIAKLNEIFKKSSD